MQNETTVNPEVKTETPVNRLAVATTEQNPVTVPKPQAVLLGAEHDLTPFASTDSTRYVINGIFYDSKKKCVVATDGRRLMTVPVRTCDREELPDALKTDGHNPAEDCIIPVSALSKALKNLKSQGTSVLPILNNVVLSKNCAPNTAILSVTDLDTTQEIKTKCVEGTYPNYNQVLPNTAPSCHVYLNPEYLEDICKYARLHTNEKTNSIKLEIWDEMSPIRATCQTDSGPAVGVLMPMRSHDTSEQVDYHVMVSSSWKDGEETIRGPVEWVSVTVKNDFSQKDNAWHKARQIFRDRHANAGSWRLSFKICKVVSETE